MPGSCYTLAHSLNTNKALDFVFCFIGILAACLMLYFIYTGGPVALTAILYLILITLTV